MVSDLLSNYFLSVLSAFLLYALFGFWFGAYSYYVEGKRSRGEIILIVLASIIWPISLLVSWIGQWALDRMDT